jgi:hypothetical protein
LDHGELDHAQEVRGQLFVACCDSAATRQPSDAALDHVATSVLFLVDPYRRLIGPLRDGGLDPGPL